MRCRRAAGRARTSGSRWCRRYPGPPVDDQDRRPSSGQHVRERPGPASPAETRTAFATRLATTRSSSPAVGVHQRARTRPARAPQLPGGWPATASGSTSSRLRSAAAPGAAAPTRRRDRSSRLSISRSQLLGRRTRSVAATSSARSAGPSPAPVSPSTAVRMVASGVRRSWDTARRIAVLVASARSRALARSSLLAQPAVLEHESGLHREPLEHPLVGRPQRVSAQRRGRGRRRPGPGAVGRAREPSRRVPCADVGEHRPACPDARRAAPRRPGRTTSRSRPDDRLRGVLPGQHRAGTASPGWPPRRAPGPPPTARREARSTTVATPTATATKTSRATRLVGLGDRPAVATGGVKNQLSSRKPPSRGDQRRHAARRPARPAPSTARNSSTSSGSWSGRR